MEGEWENLSNGFWAGENKQLLPMGKEKEFKTTVKINWKQG